jgi:hypothetical protein
VAQSGCTGQADRARTGGPARPPGRAAATAGAADRGACSDCRGARLRWRCCDRVRSRTRCTCGRSSRPCCHRSASERRRCAPRSIARASCNAGPNWPRRNCVPVRFDSRHSGSQLVALETRQRLDSRAAVGVADREAERALALAEQAQRSGIAGIPMLGEAGRHCAKRWRGCPARCCARHVPPTHRSRRSRPLPCQPTGRAAISAAGRRPPGHRASARRAGTGAFARARARRPARRASGGTGGGARGLCRPVSRVRRIVIIEHDGGWTTLVTGLARLDARVGETAVAGSPLGLAPGRKAAGHHRAAARWRFRSIRWSTSERP